MLLSLFNVGLNLLSKVVYTIAAVVGPFRLLVEMSLPRNIAVLKAVRPASKLPGNAFRQGFQI